MKDKLKNLEQEIHTLRLEQERLNAEVEKYRLMFDNFSDFLFCHDFNGVLTDVNAAVCLAYGASREELLGQNICDLFGREFKERYLEYVEKIAATGTAGGIFKVTGKNRSQRAIEYSCSIVARSNQEPYVQGVARDITDRERIEEELPKLRDRLEDLVEDRAQELITANELLRKEADKRMLAEEELYRSREESRRHLESSLRIEKFSRSLMHTSADAIILFDLKGRTRYVSPSFTRMFGWTLEEIEGIEVPFVPEGEKTKTVTIIRALLEKDTSLQEIVTKRLTKDGVPLDVSISSSRYDDHEGRPVGVLAVIRDITETRKLEAQLQHAQKMESIGTIASGVAHNFRNILAGVSVDSQLLYIKHGKNPAIAEIAHRMNRYVKRGTNLVEGLMQFARKPREFGFDRIDLAKVLRETRDLISQSFAGNIEIEHNLPETLHVLGDDTGLQQVFMNLCTNARDAMPEGGKLFISAESRGDWAEIEISDTGEGMDSETQKKCFDPFYTTKGVHRGTGLGLSTSYGIIKNHGGDVNLFSAPGHGTTFRIHLPLVGTEPDDEPTEETLWSLLDGGGRKILVVDDEKEMLKALEDLLESLSYKAITSTSGSEALSAYEEHRPDAVIMDRNIPGMDGVTCMRRIVKRYPDAKVILISGYDQEGPNGIDPETRDSICGYLTKPLDVAELSHVLGGLFDEEGDE